MSRALPATVDSHPGAEPSAPLRSLAFSDLSGKSYGEADVRNHAATVFFFVSTECPVSNLYVPRMAELARSFEPRSVGFFLVDSNGEDTADALKRFARDRKLHIPVVKDAGTALADQLAADRTPEAVILDSQAVVRYRGRIDDNRDRSLVAHSDVREALEAILAGKPVPHPRTLSFGCAIFRESKAPEKAAAGQVTYCKEVAPILFANCLSCHHKGDVGPFALETYQQAKTWGAQIKEYTARRLMPPWKAVPGYGDFQDAHRLSDEQIATLAKWVDSGAPKGDSRAMPAMPKFRDPKEWPLGKPDLVVQAPKPYHLEAEGRDVYRNFLMPIEFKEDTYLSGIDFRPGNRAVVHHVSAALDVAGETVKLEGHESEPGWTTYDGVGIGVKQWGVLDGWAPGNTSSLLPAGTALRIPKGGRLVLQVHYHKDGKEEVDQTQLGLHFAKGPVEHARMMLGVGNQTFVLKPGEPDQHVEATFTMFADAHVWMVIPHMHLLGREMKMTAVLPDGTRKPLVWVNDWDFNWQESYRYKEPIALPRGTRVEMSAVFDNSEHNPRQPSHPPREVRYGQQTTDEMCIGVFFVTLDAQRLGITPKGMETVTVAKAP